MLCWEIVPALFELMRAIRMNDEASLSEDTKILRQAPFHDWITAEGVNQKIRLLDTRASELAEVIARGLQDIASLAKASRGLNAMLMPNQEVGRLTRVREQYTAEYKNELHDERTQLIGNVKCWHSCRYDS